MSSMYFRSFVLTCISLGYCKGRSPLFELEFPSPKNNALYEVWMKIAQWLWRFFFKFRQCILSTFYNLSLERDMALHLHRLEPPAPRNVFCQVPMKSALWFQRKRFLNFVNGFFTISVIYLLEKKERGPFFSTNLNSLHQRIICTKFG